jgi:hypothetical protein
MRDLRLRNSRKDSCPLYLRPHQSGNRVGTPAKSFGTKKEAACQHVKLRRSILLRERWPPPSTDASGVLPASAQPAGAEPTSQHLSVPGLPTDAMPCIIRPADQRIRDSGGTARMASVHSRQHRPRARTRDSSRGVREPGRLVSRRAYHHHDQSTTNAGPSRWAEQSSFAFAQGLAEAKARAGAPALGRVTGSSSGLTKPPPAGFCGSKKPVGKR